MSTEPHRTESDTDAKDTDTRSPDQIEADIARDRAQLGETVDELTSRLDPKAAAKTKVEDTKARARERVTEVQTRARAAANDPDQRAAVGAKAAPVLGGIAVLALLAGLVRRRRR